jgi:hypothetical protein
MALCFLHTGQVTSPDCIRQPSYSAQSKHSLWSGISRVSFTLLFLWILCQGFRYRSSFSRKRFPWNITHQSLGTWQSLNKKRAACSSKQSRTVWPSPLYRALIFHYTLPLSVRIRIKRCSVDIQLSLRLYEGETHGNVRKKDCRYQC